VKAKSQDVTLAVRARPPTRPMEKASSPPRRIFDLSHVPTHRPTDGIANQGVNSASESLPYGDRIQAAFGRHSVSGTTVTIGGSARTAADQLGADAYTYGDRIAFAQRPDLLLAAHEAANVVQQRAPGFRPQTKVDEGHAERVASAVVSGSSVESMLDQRVGRAGHGARAPVLQLKPHEGHKSATVTIGWNGDRDEVCRRIIERVASHFHLDEGTLWQNFIDPCDSIYSDLVSSHPRGGVKLDVGFDYYPDDPNNITGISAVTIKPHAKPVTVNAATAAPSPSPAVKTTTVQAQPPANETAAQHFSRTAQETTHGLAAAVAAADREGYTTVLLEAASDGKEVFEASMQKLDKRERPRGVPLVSETAVARNELAPLLDFLAGSPGASWRYSIVFNRDNKGAMTLQSWKRLEEARPFSSGPVSDKAMLAQYGIPDRQQIYGDIFKKAQHEMKESAIMVGSFAAEQIAMWIAGGWLLKGVGLVGEAAFPRLVGLLRAGGEAEISNALRTLGDGEGTELAGLLAKLEKGGQLEAQETTRLSELYTKVEAGLEGDAMAGRAVRFTKEMKANAEIIAKGRRIDKVDVLVEKFGGKANDWVKYKTFDPASGQEVHWYEAPGIGKVGVKFKGELDPF
jgi:cell pole-organizing protein PopZ